MEDEFRRRFLLFIREWIKKSCETKKFLFLIDGDNMGNVDMLQKYSSRLTAVYFHNDTQKVWETSSWFITIPSLTRAKDATDTALIMEATRFHIQLPQKIEFLICTRDGFAEELCRRLTSEGRRCFLINNTNLLHPHLKRIATEEVFKESELLIDWD